VIRCLLCNRLGKYPTVASGNTFGTACYTDGKRVAPMLPTMPSVVHGGCCRGILWRTAATVVGQFMEQREEPEDVDAAWLKAGHLDEPDQPTALSVRAA
jgi:hypothetical protein